MPCIIPEQLVTEDKVEHPLVYDSKGCISDLSVNSIEEGVQCRRVEDTKDEGQHILYVFNIKAYTTQIGKGNVVIIEDPIEYQKSSSHTEPSNIVQKETKNIPTENTDVESEDEGKGGRKDVGFDCRRRSMDQVDVEASSEECLDTQPKRKQKKKSRRTRKREEDRDRRIVVHKYMQPPDPSESYIEFCRISDEVMMKVQVFRDNGRWREFDDALEKMSRNYSSPEGKIIILLEKSMAACYQNKLPESEDMIKIAIRDAQTTENSSSLIARANYYLSGVYRRQNCTGSADSCVDKAKQSLHNAGLTLDTTFADYEQGSVQMDFLANVPRNSKNLKALKEEAKTCLKKCIDGSVKLEQDTTTKRYIKKHHFAYIKIAMVDLDCRTAAGRNEEISVADIQEAKDCLDTLKNRYWNGIAQGEQVQYFLAMSDLSWRQNDLAKAESFALKAHSMATTFGFKTEIKPAMDRLEKIQVKLQKLSGSQLEGQSGVLDDVRSGAHLSDSHFGDVSSCESDSLCSRSFWA